MMIPIKNKLVQDFLLLLICVYFLDFGEKFQIENFGLEVLEVFAGVSRVAKFAARTGYKARAFEISFDKKYKKGFRLSKHNRLRKRSFMDINGEAGLAFLVANFQQSLVH